VLDNKISARTQVEIRMNIDMELTRSFTKNIDNAANNIKGNASRYLFE
jgi:hypothetical protein